MERIALFEERTRTLGWSPVLIAALVEEWYVSEQFVELLR